MVETILSSPLFSEVILPFILVFTITFALLQKSEVLGKGKRQIDAIVSLVIGLIVVSFGRAVGIITNLMPVLAVAMVVIVMFMLLTGIVFKGGEFDLGKKIKVVWGIIAAIVVAVAVLVFSGAWDYLVGLFEGTTGSEIVSNVVFVALIIGAVVAVVVFGGEGKSKGSE